MDLVEQERFSIALRDRNSDLAVKHFDRIRLEVEMEEGGPIQLDLGQTGGEPWATERLVGLNPALLIRIAGPHAVRALANCASNPRSRAI